METITIQPVIKPVTKTVSIPGSKSYTNRALILAVLVEVPVIIKNPLASDDIDAMLGCLKTLGISYERHTDAITVTGSIKDILDKEYLLNTRLSGTTIRFILALATIIPGIKIIKGEEGLNKRPIGDLVDALQKLGAGIEYMGKPGFPPVKVTTSTLREKKATVSGNLSSQFLSALLMIAPVAGITQISVLGEQVSKPYIDMTLSIMETFGVPVQNSMYASYVIPTRTYTQTKYTVEGDYSAAGYFAAIAALTGSTIRLTNLNQQSVQGDKEMFSILEMMGNTVTWENKDVTIIGGSINPVQVDMHNCPDQIQTLAVLAAFAKGDTHIIGIKTLRVKETDRVHALVTELGKMGIRVNADENEMIIHGGNPAATTVSTYGDHRMAMAFAVAGAKLDGMRIADPKVVNKTFPNFWETLKSIGIKTTTYA